MVGFCLCLSKKESEDRCGKGVQFPQVIYPRSHGKYSKLDMKPKSLIRRRKTYRDEEGVIVGYGAEEAYFVANPRDYETHPLREGEKRNTSIFHRSMTEALQELSDPVRKAEWSKRLHAQLNEPEPDVPVDRKTGKRHIYLRLDRYVQSVLQRQMRREAGLPGTEKG